MNKNTGLEILASECAAIPQAIKEAGGLDGQGKSVILARFVSGLSPESWEEARQSYPLGQWHALPVSSDFDGCSGTDGMRDSSHGAIAISPFMEVAGALTKGMFLKLLKCELQRLSRNGGCLSLVSASIAERRRLAIALGDGAVARLESVLGSIFLAHLESCDSLGILRDGQYVCSLPGLGQLAARNFAEKAQVAFEEAARPFFPTGGITAGQGATCAIGIVNILQGEKGCPSDLLNRAKTCLEVALTKNEGHIHQESSVAPLEGTTLVQSSEKRFLFFGGDPS